ncbi:MAG: DNA-3-methyladenine glycosylase family protein [Chloroflexota bacterium]
MTLVMAPNHGGSRMSVSSFTLVPRGPFSLRAAARFLEGFGPANYGQSAPEDHVHFAFVPQGAELAVGVCLRRVNGRVVGEVFGSGEPEQVRAEVERILSLDIDGSGYPEVGERDPVVGALQARLHGFRPVLFYSPFEAGAWAIISTRIQMSQGAIVKRRLAEQLGQSVDIHGDRRVAFPAPDQLLSLESFPGLFGRKAEYLQHLAEASLGGVLDAAALRALPESEALRQLKGISGTGDFGARLILIRGAGLVDAAPARELHFLRTLQAAYALGHEPGDEGVAAISDVWRPYRTWVTVLLRVAPRD